MGPNRSHRRRCRLQLGVTVRECEHLAGLLRRPALPDPIRSRGSLYLSRVVLGGTGLGARARDSGSHGYGEALSVLRPFDPDRDTLYAPTAIAGDFLISPFNRASQPDIVGQVYHENAISLPRLAVDDALLREGNWARGPARRVRYEAVAARDRAIAVHTGADRCSDLRRVPDVASGLSLEQPSCSL